jgi:hypothetical protein
MKNIMVIDGADNCVYDIFTASDDDFALVFPLGTDIAFIEDIERRADAERVFEALDKLWSKRIPKRDARGIHGIVFYGLYGKRRYYPTLRDEEAINPDGSALRRTADGDS